MILRFYIPALLSLLSFSAQAALTTYNNEADFIAIGSDQVLYDFETSSGFPTGNYDPAYSWIGEIDGIIFDATTIIPGTTTSGTQAMSGAGGTYTAANLDFTGSSRRVTGFGFYGLDLTAGELIRVSADFRLGGLQVFDIQLGGAADYTDIYFGAYDAGDSIRSLSILGLDTDNINRAWYLDDLRLTRIAAVPLPSTLPLFLGGLLLLGRFASKHARR